MLHSQRTIIASTSRLTQRSRTLHVCLPLRNAANSSSGSTGPSPLELAIRDGLKTAMKAKDRPAATTLKAVLADITNIAKASTDPNAPASQESVISALRKAVDKRNQAAESYAPNSPSPHPENHSSLLNEINLLRTYLPTAPSSDQLRTIITEIISGLTNDSKGAKGNSNANAAIGEVMKSLWEKLGDQKAGVDKKEVGKLVSELLKGK